MGQRYEKSRKNVAENRQTLERLHTDSETLRSEYAPLSLLDTIRGLLDDEASDAIQDVRRAGEAESQRIEIETDTAEEEKKQIVSEIDSEIAKLRGGLEKLRKSGNIEFGKRAVEQSAQEYKKQIDKFKRLIGELGESVADDGTSGAASAEMHSGFDPEAVQRRSEKYVTLREYLTSHSANNQPENLMFDDSIQISQDTLSRERYFVRGKHYDEFADFWKSGGRDYMYTKVDNPQTTYVKASEIEGVYLNGSEVKDPSGFWNKRYSKTEYMDYVSKGGMNTNPIEVTKVNDSFYYFEGDGRHRILVAKELGIDIPVIIKGIYQK